MRWHGWEVGLFHMEELGHCNKFIALTSKNSDTGEKWTNTGLNKRIKYANCFDQDFLVELLLSVSEWTLPQPHSLYIVYLFFRKGRRLQCIERVERSNNSNKGSALFVLTLTTQKCSLFGYYGIIVSLETST